MDFYLILINSIVVRQARSRHLARHDRLLGFLLVEIHGTRIVQEFAIVKVQIPQLLFCGLAGSRHCHNICFRLLRVLNLVQTAMAGLIEHLAIFNFETSALLR